MSKELLGEKLRRVQDRFRFRRIGDGITIVVNSPRVGFVGPYSKGNQINIRILHTFAEGSSKTREEEYDRQLNDIVIPYIITACNAYDDIRQIVMEANVQM